MTEHVRVESNDGEAVMTLDRQEKLNAWNYPMRERLAAELRALNRDPSVGGSDD